MTNKTILSLVAISIVGVMSLGTVFAAGGDFFNLQNNGEQIFINNDGNHPAIELRDKDNDGNRPYIDFVIGTSEDYHARLVLSSSETLKIKGADLKIDQKIASSNYCNLDRTQCSTLEELASSVCSPENIQHWLNLKVKLSTTLVHPTNPTLGANEWFDLTMQIDPQIPEDYSKLVKERLTELGYTKTNGNPLNDNDLAFGFGLSDVGYSTTCVTQ